MTRRVSSAPYRRTGLGLAAVVLATGVLSGCGVSEARVLPGSAADVGGTRIDSGDVESAVPGACAYLTAQGVPTIPLLIVRQDVVVTFMQEAAIKAVAEDLGVTVGSGDAVDLLGADEGLSDDQVQATTDYLQARTFVDNGLLALSAELPDDSAPATTPGDPNAAIDALKARALTTFVIPWFADHDVAVNPSFGIDIDDTGNFVPVDDGLSVAASDLALSGVIDLSAADAQTKVSALVARLPADQVCGTPVAAEPAPAAPSTPTDVVPSPRPQS